MGCCLVGCVRFFFFQVWRLLAAALLALLLARIDTYVEARHPDNTAGKAWRAYRRRGKGTPSP